MSMWAILFAVQNHWTKYIQQTAPHKIWWKLVKRFWWRRHLKITWFYICIPEFSETPNPAYFYAYFCFCTRKISFRGFSFTLYCHRTSKLNFKDVPRTSEISFVRRNRSRDVQKLSKSPPTFNELYDVCPAYLLEIRYLCWLSFKDVPLSACGSFIDIGVKRRGTLLMAAWSLCVFVTRAELINWCLYNKTFFCDTRKYSVKLYEVIIIFKIFTT